MRALKMITKYSSKISMICQARFVFGALLLLAVLSGCVNLNNSQPGSAGQPTQTIHQPTTDPTSNAVITDPLPTITPALQEKRIPSLSFSPAVPIKLIELVKQTEGANISAGRIPADFQLAPEEGDLAGNSHAEWVYALVAPFPTVSDGLSMQDFQELWRNGQSEEIPFKTIYLSSDTLSSFSNKWGKPDDSVVRIAKQGEILDLVWAEKDILAIIPFESIVPRWKVLQVDGMSPLDPTLDIQRYPLKINYEWQFKPGVDPKSIDVPPRLPVTNRDPEKFTTVVLTGTTALVREIAAKMEQNGVDYPAGDIAEWLKSADITHISNEVSFYQNCPTAIPVRKEMRFCSDPKYIDLFEAVGADVIESTGNHIVDWGVEPFVYTLGLYKQHGFEYYGGGLNLEEARKPLIIEHNGTRLAFIGCNIAGPENVYATTQSAGAAPCDLEWMAAEVKKLRSQGILPIVTFQHYEVDDYQPMNLTKQHFQLMAGAGAVIVSGSQAHFAHGFGFSDDTFMHYGLGNLFFDQMFIGNRREFIDRHVFYDGHYLGVELLTAILEDYSRPRPMTADERAQMLTTYFQVSGW